jgi:prune family protein 2
MDNSRTKPDLIPETSVPEERDEERNWRSVVIMGLERKIDLKVIEPYKKVTLLSCFCLFVFFQPQYWAL